MAEVAATGTQTPVRQGPSASSRAPWAGIHAQDWAELLANLPSRAQLRPPRRDYLENVLRFVEVLRRASIAAAGRPIFTTVTALHLAIGGEDQGSHEANHEAGYSSVRRYLDVLEEMGAIAWQGRQGDGGGLTIELRDPRCIQLSYGRSRPPSVAAGRLITCQARRRRESAAEARTHRVKPGRRRKGAPPRHDVSWGAGTPSFFGRDYLAPSFGAPAPYAPTGLGAGAIHLLGARERARAGRGVDDAAGGTAAVQGSAESRGWEGGQAPAVLVERLDALLADAAQQPDLAASRAWAAFWLIWGRRSARTPRRRWEQLRRCLRRGDRYGRGAAAGLNLLAGIMVAHRGGLESGESAEPAPAGLAYYLPELERRTRQWRRQRDPDRRAKSAAWRRQRGERYQAGAGELRRGRRRRR